MDPQAIVQALMGNSAASAQADFMRAHHLRELSMGGVPNQGGLSTYYGMTAGDPAGVQRMLPTVWGGQILPPAQAYQRAQQTGLWHYPGSFSPTRTLYNYMNDPNQHPRMEQDTAAYLSTGGQP